MLLRLAVKAGSVDEDRRPAGARALHRAHGVQRQRALQARRADLDVRIDRRAARAARQRLHRASTKRSTCSSCRPTSRTSSQKGLQALADFAGGLTLDPEGDRQGTRRRHRGVARRPRRRIAHPRQADSRSSTTSRSYAERLPIGKPEILRTPRRRGCARSTTRGIGPNAWRVVVVGDIDAGADRERDQARRSVR